MTLKSVFAESRNVPFGVNTERLLIQHREGIYAFHYCRIQDVFVFTISRFESTRWNGRRHFDPAELVGPPHLSFGRLWLDLLLDTLAERKASTAASRLFLV